MRIQHNIMALNSHRQLGNNNSAVSKSLEKLSSGYRINRAGDDAAGLAISEKMRAQIKGLTAASDNSQDAISLVQTAEGGLQEVHSMLNRMQELATKSSNGTYTDDVDRKALQDEVSALKDEINRIADSTNFNGINLLDGSMNSGGAGIAFDVAAGSSAAAGELKDAVKFEFTAPEGYKIEIKTDVTGTSASAAWGAGKTLTITLDGTANKEYDQEAINNLIATASGTPSELQGKVGLKIDRNIVIRNAGAGNVTAAAQEAVKAVNATATDAAKGITVTSTKGGNVTSTLTFTATAGNPLTTTVTGTGDTAINLVGGKSYTASEINDMLSKAGSEMRVSYDGAYTGGELEAAGTGGVFTLAGGAGLSTGGGLKLQIGDTNDTWNQLELSIEDMHVTSLGIGDIDISGREGAVAAISKIKDAINQVSTSRGKLGAIQNRLEHTINNLGVTTENITAAESRIRDVDMAKEMMEFTKNSVLMQSAQAMLAQANQQPQSILQLLQ